MRKIRWAAVGLAAGLLALLGPGRVAMAQTEDPGPVTEVLRERLDQLQTTGRIEAGGAEILSRHALPVLYGQNGYRPFWTPERLDVLLELVRDSAEDGLRPEDYHQAALTKLAPALKAPSTDAATRAQGDLLATDAFVLLLYHLYLGKVDPKSLDAVWNFEPVRSGIRASLRARRADAGPAQGDRRQSPSDHWWYARVAPPRPVPRPGRQGGWARSPPARNSSREERRAGPGAPAPPAATESSGQPLDSETFDEPSPPPSRSSRRGIVWSPTAPSGRARSRR
jgi:hypothetical protein